MTPAPPSATSTSLFYITKNDCLGNPHGIRLSLTKTKLLTSVTGTSPTVSAHDTHFLCQAL
jgi:hypothetical protein